MSKYIQIYIFVFYSGTGVRFAVLKGESDNPLTTSDGDCANYFAPRLNKLLPRGTKAFVLVSAFQFPLNNHRLG